MARDDKRFERADPILDDVLDLPADERSAFLDRACEGDPELRELVDRLVRHATEDEGDWLTPGGGLVGEVAEDAAAALERADAMIGSIQGAYRILREVGQGGMAIVYLAERADGAFDQRVAFKVVRHGLATGGILKRFEQERRILARIEHPNIARVLDGGTTTDGRPYVVMEWVDGTPIDRYCDRRESSVRERIALFLDLAGAVAHAHRGLVVHRDIKPSNILVDADGLAKLLDFGIARVLDPDGASTEATRTSERMLTPAYASPEQIRGQPVTTASDVYQLGLLLYVLLAGELPYADVKDDAHELPRAICDREPTRPSVVLERSADDTDAARRRREISSDLETIVLMALRKEPERRYTSVAQLADDLRRWLAGRPVSARADTVTYRVRKFVGRNRRAVAVAAVSGIALVALVTYGTGKLARERDAALAALDEAEEVTAFLEELFESPDPEQARGRDVTAMEILDRGADRLEREWSDRPTVRARIAGTIGAVYRNLGRFDRAAPLLEEAAELRRDRAAPEDPAVLADAIAELGRLRVAQGEFEAAEADFREAIEIVDGHDPFTAAVIRLDLGDLMFQRRELDAAETVLREAIAILEDPGTVLPGGRGMAEALTNLAVVVGTAGREDEALPLMERAIEMQRATLGDDHPDVAVGLHNLGVTLGKLSRWEEAEARLLESMERSTAILGPEHPRVINTMSNLGSIYERTGRSGKAEEFHLRTLELRERVLGSDHFDVAISLDKLSQLCHKQERYEEALAYGERMLAIRLAVLGEQHPRMPGQRNYVERLRGIVAERAR